MARPATGQVVFDERRRSPTFGLRFRAYGQRQYLTLGSVDEGWTHAKAQLELQNVLADVRRGKWQPPTPEPAQAAAADPTFHEFASEWFDAKRHELRPKTIEDYGWRLSNHLLPFFADLPLSQIDERKVDRYRTGKLRDGELSPRSINMTLTLLAAVLEQAVDYRLISTNPAAGRRRRIRESRPARSYLDTAAQIGALLDAACELDARAAAHPYHRHIHRRAMIATLAFAGLRLGELLALRWRDVDLAAGRLRVGAAKTDAGVRDIHLKPVLRDELLALKASTPASPDEIVFATSTGRAIGASNFRRRVLAPAVEHANARLLKADGSPLPTGLTPHSLRRTFASVLYAIGTTPPVVMAEMGHTSPVLALSIYAQAMSRDQGQLEELRELVGLSNGQRMGSSDDLALLEAAADAE